MVLLLENPSPYQATANADTFCNSNPLVLTTEWHKRDTSSSPQWGFMLILLDVQGRFRSRFQIQILQKLCFRPRQISSRQNVLSIAVRGCRRKFSAILKSILFPKNSKKKEGREVCELQGCIRHREGLRRWKLLLSPCCWLGWSVPWLPST